MKKKGIYIILLLFAGLVGCKEDEVENGQDRQKQEEFMQQTLPGIYAGSRAAWNYDPNIHQAVYGKNNFRLQTDNQKQLADYSWSGSIALNQKTDVTLTVSGIEGMESGTYPVEVVKAGGERFWLWCSARSVGFLILRNNEPE